MGRDPKLKAWEQKSTASIDLGINLREFVLTTVIMAPGACRTQGRSAQKWTDSGSEGFAPDAPDAPENSRSIIWMHRNNGFSVFGWENDLRFSYNFDFQGRIYLKVEITFFEKNQNIDFQGRICLKVETRIFTKVDEIFDPPRGVQRAPQGAQRAPQGVQRAPQDLFVTPILYIQTPHQPQSGCY